MTRSPYIQPDTEVFFLSVESFVLYGGGGTQDMPKDIPGEWEQ